MERCARIFLGDAMVFKQVKHTHGNNFEVAYKWGGKPGGYNGS